jgi:hypothetical protein
MLEVHWLVSLGLSLARLGFFFLLEVVVVVVMLWWWWWWWSQKQGA